MRFIPTVIHGTLDYIMGVVLIAAPWLLGFAEGGAAENWGAATWVPVIIGAGIILQSLMTSYECGLVGLISMKAHLAVDVVAGIVLAVSPWIFGFADRVWIPHVVFGVAALAAGLMTKTVPTRTPRTTGPRHAGA